MVLLIEDIRPRFWGKELVSTLTEFGERVGEKIGSNTLVHSLPGIAAVRGAENTHGRHPNPEPIIITRIKHHAMETKPAQSGLPLVPRRMVGKPRTLIPGIAVVLRLKKGGRLDPSI